MSSIVIHEENDLMRALLEEWLSNAGYSIRAGTPREARGADAVDLVIVSIYMPKQSGVRLVREVKAIHPGTPVIAVSGQFHSGLPSNGATAQALGVQQVLAKPLTRRALLDAVRATIGPAD
jgi:DNA-binding response OmpR family regulator